MRHAREDIGKAGEPTTRAPSGTAAKVCAEPRTAFGHDDRKQSARQ
ncbi:hypothetical protein ACFXAE_04070 [Streptomyces sp. NPDC059454]